MASVMSSVKAALSSAGYRTGDANPGGTMPEITGPVVAVNLDRVNVKNKTMVIRATVIVPLAMGARTCEDHALTVCKKLSELGANCEMQPSQFNAKTEMFSAAILITFQGNVIDEGWMLGESCMVRFGAGYYLDKVNSITSWQETKEDQVLEDSMWTIQIEEQLDEIRQEDVPTNVAKITVAYEAGEEVYNECKLTGRKRIIRDGNLIQIWEATAGSRTVDF